MTHSYSARPSDHRYLRLLRVVERLDRDREQLAGRVEALESAEFLRELQAQGINVREVVR